MYTVNIKNNGESSFKVISGNYEFAIDTKSDSPGISPPAALLAGLGSCIGVYIRKYAQGANLGLEGFEIIVNAELTFFQDPPVRFEKINVAVNLKGAELDERRQNALLDFIKNCPVHNTLKGNPEIDVKIA